MLTVDSSHLGVYLWWEGPRMKMVLLQAQMCCSGSILVQYVSKQQGLEGKFGPHMLVMDRCL